jgi:hypothetical protein
MLIQRDLTNPSVPFRFSKPRRMNLYKNSIDSWTSNMCGGPIFLKNQKTVHLIIFRWRGGWGGKGIEEKIFKLLHNIKAE